MIHEVDKKVVYVEKCVLGFLAKRIIGCTFLQTEFNVTIKKHLIKLSKHIAYVPLVSLLIVIGLGMAQLHDVAHATESVQTQGEQPQEQLPVGQQDNDCLVCTLTLSALTGTTLQASTDYSSKDKITFPTYNFTSSTATKHIRLRAPPVSYITS